jgi:hypothetical protein
LKAECESAHSPLNSIVNPHILANRLTPHPFDPINQNILDPTPIGRKDVLMAEHPNRKTQMQQAAKRD